MAKSSMYRPYNLTKVWFVLVRTKGQLVGKPRVSCELECLYFPKVYLASHLLYAPLTRLFWTSKDKLRFHYFNLQPEKHWDILELEKTNPPTKYVSTVHLEWLNPSRGNEKYLYPLKFCIMQARNISKYNKPERFFFINFLTDSILHERITSQSKLHKNTSRLKNNITKY